MYKRNVGTGSFKVLAVALALALLLAACRPAVTPAPTSVPPTPVPEPVTLTMWHIHPSGPLKEMIDHGVARFEEAHPNVTVEIVPLQMDEFKTKLLVAMAAGNPPDLFHTWGGGILKDYAEKGMVYELTDAMKEEGWGDRFTPSILSLVTFDGKTYAAPVELASVWMYYNQEIFDQYGISAPESFEELKGVCEGLKAEGVIPISLGNSAKWTGAFYFIYLADRMAGPELFDKAVAREPGYSFADPAYIEAGKKLQELVDIGCFPEGFNGMSYDEQRMLFATEKAAMMLMGTWLPGAIEKEMPGITAKMDFFTFPAVEGGKGDPSNVVGGTNTAYAIASTTKHPEAAVELLKELSSDETVKELVEVVGRVSGVKAQVDVAKVPPLTVKAMKALETAGHLQLYYDQYLPPAMAETHKDTTQALFGKTMTAEEAAQAMEEAAMVELGGQ